MRTLAPSEEFVIRYLHAVPAERHAMVERAKKFGPSTGSIGRAVSLLLTQSTLLKKVQTTIEKVHDTDIYLEDVTDTALPASQRGPCDLVLLTEEGQMVAEMLSATGFNSGSN